MNHHSIRLNMQYQQGARVARERSEKVDAV